MPDHTCAVCDGALPPKLSTGPRATYCSRSCRGKADYAKHRADRLVAKAAARVPLPQKGCGQCGLEFQPTRRDQRFCSRPCGQNFHRDSSIEICSEDGCELPRRAKGLCAKHYTAQSPNRKLWKKNGRPETRRANLRRKTQLRRARLRDPDAESIDRDVIGERDGWRCGLCRKPVDSALAWPHPLSPSLDHIEPLSLGGKHAAGNVQISHLTCNVAKGNRATDVQPLLIG